MADIDERAPGLVLAKELGLPVSTRYQDLLAENPVDLIIDVTGNLDVGRAIRALKSDLTEVIGGLAARFIWEFIEAGGQTRALEEKDQLALRELEAHSESEFIVGNNPKMKELSHLIAKVAPTPRQS